MEEVRVTCKNEEELTKILEIARKEGYRWIGGGELSDFKPTCNYPYDIIFRNYLAYAAVASSCSAEEFVGNYSIDHAEPFGISQKIKNKIILDFMEKWHEIRVGCAVRTCRTCKFFRNIAGSTVCKLDDVDNTTNKETFLDAVKLLMDVVESGDTRILRLTTSEAVEMIRKEIKSLHGKEDDETQGHIEALKMAARALEEKENGSGAKIN